MGGDESRLARYGALLLPADNDIPAQIVEADAEWSWDPQAIGEAEVVVWGRPPFRSFSSAHVALAGLARRERVLRRITRRPPPGWLVDGVVRLDPPPARGGAARAAGRSFVLSGALVRLSARSEAPSVLDRAVAQSGGRFVERSFKPGSDGAAVAQVVVEGGEVAFLRIAPKGSPGDPAHSAKGLLLLEQAGVTGVPRSLCRGTEAGASWVLESRIPGRRPRRIDGATFEQVAALLAALPRGAGPPTAWKDDLARLGDRFPDRSGALADIAGMLEGGVSTWPGIMRHGDLWPGNVMVSGGRLTGVLDWDGWHAAGVPGTDLLQLFGARGRTRRGRRIGDRWGERPWRSKDFVDGTASYWESVGLHPTGEVLDLVAVAWWAGWVAAAVERHRHLVSDERWTSVNVDRVLESVERD